MGEGIRRLAEATSEGNGWAADVEGHKGATHTQAKPIVILGAAHSGTTILYKMLAMAAELTWFSQFSQRSGIVSGRRRVPYNNQLDRWLRVLFSFDWRKEEGRLKRLFVPRPGEAKQIWEYIIPTSAIIPLDESVQRMRQIFELESRFWRTPSIVTKLPRLYQHIPLIQAAYPQTRFIHIVRDGRAVALSVLDKFMRHGESKIEGLEAAAQYWVKIVDKVNKYRKEASILEIRYEDFCTDVHGHMREILHSVCLSEETFPFDRCPSILRPTNQKWLQVASDEQIQILEERQRNYLAVYGYGRK